MKERDWNFNNNKFSFKMRQRNLSKSTKMFKIPQTQKRKREFFPTSFAVILSAVALPIVLKGEFNLELILYITVFVF